MRHGPAEDSSPSGRDFDRPLSENGRTRTTAVARELERRGERPRRIFASPLARAQQTAEIVAGVLGGTVETRDELSPSEASPDILREIRAAAPGSVLLVGHAPDVSILAAELIGKRATGFEPAMVVAIDMEDAEASGPGKEAFVIRPSALD